MTTIHKVAIWKRLQVAILGLGVVFASIFGANILIDQVGDDQDLANANLQQDIAETGGAVVGEEASIEPLAELGVAPVPKDGGGAPAAKVAEPGANPVSEDTIIDDDESLISKKP